MPFDPYEVLGVRRYAGGAEIKAAFRDLAKRYHPDLHRGDPSFAAKFRAVNEAYEVLCDARARSALDMELAGREGSAFTRTAEPPPGAEGRRPPPPRPGPRPRAAKTAQKTGPKSRMPGDARQTRPHGAGVLVAGCLLALALGVVVLHYGGSDRPRPDSASSAAGYVPPPDTLPDIAKEDRLAGPAPGLFVPDQNKLHLGFSLASVQSAYWRRGYKTIFTLYDGTRQRTVAFSETLGAPFEPLGAGSQSFEYLGDPGGLSLLPLADGTVDGLLHWDDRGSQIVVHVLGAGPGELGPQELMMMLAALRRVTEAQAAPPPGPMQGYIPPPPPPPGPVACTSATCLTRRYAPFGHVSIKRTPRPDSPS